MTTYGREELVDLGLKDPVSRDERKAKYLRTFTPAQRDEQRIAWENRVRADKRGGQHWFPQTVHLRKKVAAALGLSPKIRLVKDERDQLVFEYTRV